MIIATCLRHAVTGSLDGKLIVWDCWTGNKIQVNFAFLHTLQLTTKNIFLGISRLEHLETLLVQRCNGITAGLGYLEVNVICPCKSPHLPIGPLTSVRSPLHGEWLDSPADFNLTKTSLQSPDHFTSTPPFNPQVKLLVQYVKCTRLNTNL
jgi:hypothetical protein